MDKNKIKKEMLKCLEKNDPTQENIEKYIKFLREEYDMTNQDIENYGVTDANIAIGVLKMLPILVLGVIILDWASVSVNSGVAIIAGTVVGVVGGGIIERPSKMARLARKYLIAKANENNERHRKEIREQNAEEAEKYKARLDKTYCSMDGEEDGQVPVSANQ